MKLLITAVLTATSAAFFSSPAYSTEANRAQFEPVFEKAAREFDVPADLLKAIAFVETRWTPTLPSESHAGDSPGSPHPHAPTYGMMGLRNDPWFGQSLIRAAQLIDSSPEALKWDTELNIRGAAALLRELARPEDSLRAWSPDPKQAILHWAVAVQKYSGIPDLADQALYARDVFEVLGQGYDQKSIFIPAWNMTLPRLPGEEEPEPKQVADYAKAEFDPSPNFRPDSIAPQFVVVHLTEGSFAGAVSWLKNPKSVVSAHYIVRSRDGFIKQLVREKDRAWHARCWNKAAIGIEHEGFAKNPEFLTPEMYQASADLVSHLSAQYSIPATDRYIVGHNFWSTPGFEQSPIAEIGKCNDHDDPGQFWSWNLFLSLIRR